MRKINIVEISIMSCLSFALTFVRFFHLPHGGSITFAMIPIILISFRRGYKIGIFSGIVVSILKILSGSRSSHPLSLMLDYILAYGVVGVAGLFKKENKCQMFFAVFTAFFMRFICHTISGAIFFKFYFPVGANPWIYSLLINASYIVPDFILNFLVFLLIEKKLEAK